MYMGECGAHTIYALTFMGLNFRGFPVFAIFAVCDIIAQALPVGLNLSGMKLSQIATDL